MMKKNLYREIEQFLQNYISKGSKVLLAYSGGPDSVALMHLLLRGMKSHSFTLELAHVDHGQRKESEQEAKQIQSMALKRGLKLYLKVLKPPLQDNLENYYRNERLNFFSNLVKEKGYEAVLIAHHEDDLKETILKRFLEGAPFEHFKGIQIETILNGVRILRPLLNVSKKELLQWLKEQTLDYFVDHTNEDTHFLRARMRKELFPLIEQNFGKGIQENLLWVAKQSKSYQNYLEKQVQFKFSVASSSLGFSVDFRKKDVHPLEIQFFIRDILRKRELSLSREQIDEVTGSLLKQQATKTWNNGKETFYTYRGLFFYLAKPSALKSSFELPLQPGEFIRGVWKFKVEQTHEEAQNELGWQRLFQKEPKFIIYLPINQSIKIRCGELCPPRFYFEKKTIKWWEEHKIPPFLRTQAPILEIHGDLMGEFLTQKTPFDLGLEKLKLTICYQKPLK